MAWASPLSWTIMSCENVCELIASCAEWRHYASVRVRVALLFDSSLLDSSTVNVLRDEWLWMPESTITEAELLFLTIFIFRLTRSVFFLTLLFLIRQKRPSWENLVRSRRPVRWPWVSQCFSRLLLLTSSSPVFIVRIQSRDSNANTSKQGNLNALVITSVCRAGDKPDPPAPSPFLSSVELILNLVPLDMRVRHPRLWVRVSSQAPAHFSSRWRLGREDFQRSACQNTHCSAGYSFLLSAVSRHPHRRWILQTYYCY